MNGPVSWEMLSIVVGAVVVAGGIIIALAKWVYNDSNTRRAEVMQLAMDFANKIASVREDIAIKYVTVETHALISKTLEKAIEDLKVENRSALDKLGDRIDHTLIALTEALKQKQ